MRTQAVWRGGSYSLQAPGSALRYVTLGSTHSVSSELAAAETGHAHLKKQILTLSVLQARNAL